jgi:hypothetical protein
MLLMILILLNGMMDEILYVKDHPHPHTSSASSSSTSTSTSTARMIYGVGPSSSY